jgi:DNA-binding MarR family transcriptional regulator
MKLKQRMDDMKGIEMEAAEVILDGFIEELFRLMLDDHQTHVVEMDLTLVQAQALKLLRAAPLPTSKLAAALGISAPAVTQLTDRLGRKRLIERQALKTDRRAVMVAITEKGGRVIDGFRKRRNEVFADTLSRLSDEDRVEVIDALSKIVAVLGGHEPIRLAGLSAPASLQADHPVRRTAAEAPEASKRGGQVSVSLPPRRMRIEWD